MNPMNPSRVARWGGVAGLVAAVGAVGFGTLQGLREVPVLHASSAAAAVMAAPDSDGDGLPDLAEATLGTSIDRPDSDGDGYWDAEELARQSNPNDRSDIPSASPASVGMTVYESGETLRPVVAVYFADGNVRSADLGMGVRLRKSLRGIPLEFFSSNASVVKTPTVQAQSAVYVYDGTLASRHVHRYGDLSVYSTVTYRGTVIQADALNFLSEDGIILLAAMAAVHSSTSGTMSAVAVGQGTSGVYNPLGSNPPPTGGWSSGKVCAQSMVVVGVVGAVVIQEVVSADCESGWESYCSSSCSGTVGGMVQMVDPVALIGG